MWQQQLTRKCEDRRRPHFLPGPQARTALPGSVGEQQHRRQRLGKVRVLCTDNQAQEILAEVSTQDFSEVRLFKSADDDGQPIDGSTVIEQFHIEQGLPES